MAKILLIETATEVCSTAIAVDGQVIALVEVQDTQSHASLLTLQIAECVQKSGIALADLDAVALSSGPGSYTSLRVGASVAKGICYALDKPLLAVDTLKALALASLPSTVHRPPSTVLLMPMLEARRQEVWVAIYNTILQQLVPAQPLVLEHNLFENLIRQASPDESNFVLVLSGNGCLKAKSVIFDERVVWSEIGKISAKYMAGLAEQVFQNTDYQDIAYFEPFYMKPPNITISNKVW